MKFFIDTANVEEIRALAALGFVDGVTTNPSLVALEDQPFTKILEEICTLTRGPVSAEVTASDAQGMIKEGEFLAQIAKNIAVKVPLTLEGLQACRVLSAQGILVNVTLCFSTGQALLAAKAGAAFVSPFIGRLDDISADGTGLIHEIAQVFANYDHIKTEILAASIRHPRHVIDSALAGAHIATIPPKILYQLFKHPLTDAGVAAFERDWAKTGQKIL